MYDELKYLIALMNIKGVGSSIARHLIEQLGSAKAVFETEDHILRETGHIGELIINGKADHALFDKADSEIEFIVNHNIKATIYKQEGYPKRLAECQDAPALLFSLGNANLDSKHIVSIVGTRSSSHYGKDNVRNFIEGIKEALPDTVIVSGLALGIDISAHNASLEFGLPTVGVVAHGLDTIYPYNHRQIAKKMIDEGGSLITEYTSGTIPERGNFLARNRIIAGLADAVIVAESKDKGGSLVTASIALDYGRDVFAFPGRVNDLLSAGCNRLIRQNRAGLITCAQDFLEAMNWDRKAKSLNGVQHTIGFEEDDLSPTARTIIDALRQRGDMRLNQIAIVTNIDQATLTESLLMLEIEGKVRNVAGGLYQLR